MAFIANLMNARVEFVACDNPHATRLTLHVLAAVAEHEREMISAQTKAALAIARTRGVKLGNARSQTITPGFAVHPKAGSGRKAADEAKFARPDGEPANQGRQSRSSRAPNSLVQERLILGCSQHPD